MLLVLNMWGFWIYHGQHARVTHGSQYVWIIHEYAWLCLNIPKSSWMAFALHLAILIPYLKEPQAVFLKSKNLIFSILAGSVSFCIFLDWMFLHWISLDWMLQAFKFAVTFVGRGDVNLDIPDEYIYDVFLMIYWSIFLLFFFHFLVLHRT